MRRISDGRWLRYRAPDRRARAVRQRLGSEQLESRLALCASHAVDFIDPLAVPSSSLADSFAINLASSTGSLSTLDGGVIATAAAANGLPDLHSLLGAPTAIYLDFNGEGSNAAYDVDGDPTTFNATEAATITEAWRQISVYFAMFNVDVTTVKPSVPFAWHVSSPDITGGYSYVGVFPNSSPQSFNNAGDARTRVSGIAHELGHNFGLQHQSNYDLLGNKTAEYSSGFDLLHGPLMGVDYAQSVHKWFIGHPSNSVSGLQDDMAVIAGKIKAREPAGGDGYRADDYGGTIATARALAATSGSRTISGIIERMADVDTFSFTATVGGAVVSVVPTKPSGLDAKVEIYDASGVLVAASDGGTNEQQVVLPVGAGTWYVSVSSHGDYGDVGMYDLSVNDLPAGWSSADVGSTGILGDAGYDAATGTFTVAGSGADVFGTADAFRFAWQTLTGDGSIVARVTKNQNTNAWSKVGVEIRETLAAGSKHVAMVTSATSGPQMVSRTSTGGSSTSVNGTAATFTPTWVRLVRAGNVITASRSADGVAWTTVGSTTVSMASTVYIGLLTCSHDTAKVNEATFTNVTVTGTLNAPAAVNALAAPTGVAAARGTGTAVAVSWQAVASATGYVVERSDDGVDFADAGTATASATSWTDASLAGSMRYFYRVRATDASGRSVPSVISSVINRPSAVTSATVTSLTVSQVVLNWRDKSGDSGYRIERSTDNVTFTQIGTVATNYPSYSATGLAVGTRYWFRITPMSPYGDSVSTVITGSTRLQVVGSMSFTSKTSSAIGIQWTAVTAATGYRIERSTDGSTFSTLGSVAGDVLTYSDATVTPLGEYYYRVIATNATAEGVNPALPIFAAAPAAALPAPWSSADIGNVPGTGASGLSSGTFTVVSSGSDIWSTADAFRYTSQPLVGDGSIVARVASVESTAGWAKIGVMIRESTASNSRHAMMVVSPSNSVAMQYRSATGGSSTSIAGPAGLAAPYWVRLVRAGNVLTGSCSPDGTTWTQVGSVTISMASSVLVGLSANSNSSTLLNKSTFTNVTLSNNAPTVATSAAASPSTVTATTATVSVLGADDHGESSLTYSWAATGPAGVTFSASGTNSAKSSVATFTKAGSYTLTATITDTGGLKTTSAVNVTVSQTLTGVVVTPATVSLFTGSTQQFAASAVDQFGDPLSSQPAFTWSATGGGSITTAGLFTAPATASTTTVRATSGSVFGTAAVTTSVPVAAPTVATAAAASPVTVTGTTTTLSVLGADDTGEAALAYTWSSSGPAAASFSANGTNTAKSTVATFTKAGSYTLTATIRDPGGLTVTSAVQVVVSQTLTTIAVTPSSVGVFTEATQQFAASARDQFGDLLATQPVFAWQVTDGGAISSTGLFTAAATAGTSTITAAAGGVAGSATALVSLSPNDAPTVATVATASATTVTGKTTSLSVLGVDDGGEAALTYAWSASGPAAVSFSATGTNAAKSSVATFTRAGSYTLTATITDARGAAVTSAVSVTVTQKITAMAVTPGTATLVVGGTQQFSAVAVDQFGIPLVTQPSITWLVSGGGSITSSGLFTAPAAASSSQVVAAAALISGKATVTTTTDLVVTVAGGQTSTDSGGRSGSLTLVKRGTGTLVLSGPSTNTGGTVVEAGELVIRDLAALGSGRLEVRAGGRVTIDVGIGEIALPALVVDPLGRVDIGAGRITVAATGLAESSLRQLLLAGRGDGSWDGATGIMSRVADPNSGRTVGYAPSADAITIAFAAAGDANLDGIIDVADLANFMSNIDSPALVSAAWGDGDFNYDGIVDQLDLSEFLGTGLFDQGIYLSAMDAAFADLGRQ
ncbi:MAG: autotransporter-associated beta strand repeat-containing protein [Planctomycetaceae bacterium]